MHFFSHIWFAPLVILKWMAVNDTIFACECEKRGVQKMIAGSKNIICFICVGDMNQGQELGVVDFYVGISPSLEG